MPVDKKLEIKKPERDSRTVDQRVVDFFTSTTATIGIFVGMVGLVFVEPWLHHLFGPMVLIWWTSVAFDRKRQVLPYALPRVAARTDYNDPVGGGRRFNKASGIIFLGNAANRFFEVWETSSHARQHHLVIGTTGSGKSVMLTGLYANFVLLGAGCIFSDAKGTKLQVSELWNLARRFGRDVDFFSLNYSTGGMSVRDARRDRLSNRSNPCSFASTDQINQMFMSFLPKSSGENQIFQDKAITMFTALTPALVDRRDLHNEPLHVPKIRNYVGSLQRILDLALDHDHRITPKSREVLANYLRTLPNFDWEAFLDARKANVNYEIHAEAFRMFSYAQNYFMRALNSLSDTYGHIYNYESGEADYLDIVLNRRILVISLPALEKAPTELGNLAKINLSNLRGAIAFTTGQRVEGKRAETLDNLPSTSEVPTGIILDEYGYQATEGFAITLAQARGLGFSITVAGQDLANLKMGGEAEFDGIFGNAILICMKIRNLKDIGDRVREMVGEADVAIESGMERSDGVLKGYRSRGEVSIQRRARLNPPDLLKQNTGEAILMVGGDLGFIPYETFAPLPKAAEEFHLNRFLPISFEVEHHDARIELARRLEAWVKGRLEGATEGPSTHTALPSGSLRPMWEKIREAKQPVTQASWYEQARALVEGQVTPSKATAEPRPITAAESAAPLTRTRPVDAGDRGGGGARPAAEPQDAAARVEPQPPPPPANSPSPTRPLPRAAQGPEDFQQLDASGWDKSAGAGAPRIGFGMEIPVTRSLIPLREDLDTETEDQAVGDFTDQSQIPALEEISIQVDAAEQALNPDAASRRGAGPAAVARDLTAGLKDGATYRPLEGSPTEPVTLDELDKTIECLLSRSKNRRKRMSADVPSTNDPSSP